MSAELGGMFMSAIRNQWLAVLIALFTFIGGYQVRGYQVAQHEQRIEALEQSAPSAREWQELNRRLDRIENKLDKLAEQKADKK